MGRRCVAQAVVVLATLLCVPACRPATSTAPVAAPRVVSTPSVVSGGLGLSREAWNNRYEPSNNVSSSSTLMFYRVAWDDHATVYFTAATNQSPDLVTGIEVRMPLNAPSIDEARDTALGLLPQDAVFVDSSRQAFGGRIVLTDLYSSDSLSQMFLVACKPRAGLGARTEQASISYAVDRRSSRLAMATISWACPRH